ncbi:GNAT family N-acetyltransferase [Planococcus sp. MERTA32b]|nr:GNAT family N-acetyltransferase [Planococcus sp. MER TA 32b]
METLKDIYFNQNYGMLYEEVENGKCECYEFRNALGSVRHLFIKREIPIRLPGGGVYYDLVTPYGYGGPVMEPVHGVDKKDLAKAFMLDFEQYCIRENVVSEFIRFHPVLRNAEDFREFYDTVFMRPTIQTRIAATEDPLMSEYTPSVRRYIRKALKEGVEYKVYVNPVNLDKFQELYLRTMERNKADEYYYFDEEYFSKCLSLLRPQLVVVEVSFQQTVIAMSLNFVSDGLLHVHLAGSLENYHHLYAPNILQYALLQWGMENNIRLIHHGGGRTNDPDDKLYLYKKKYGRAQELEFHIGRRIWNTEIYWRLCREVDMETGSSFFPAYRQNLRIKEKVN